MKKILGLDLGSNSIGWALLKEAENREVSFRKQGEGDKGTMKFEEFAKKMNEEVQNMINKW